MPDEDLINRIRGIFLHQRPHVTVAEATVLLGWSRGEMLRAIAAGEVEVTSTSIGKWIARQPNVKINEPHRRLCQNAVRISPSSANAARIAA
jgi:hypothetical protein